MPAPSYEDLGAGQYPALVDIRIADEGDVQEILELLTTRDWQDDLDLGRGPFYIAWEGRVIGCLQRIDLGENSAVLDLVVVAESRRRQGVGSALVATQTSDLRRDFYVACRDDAVAFYEKSGFQLIQGGVAAAPDLVKRYWRAAGNRAPLAMMHKRSERQV